MNAKPSILDLSAADLTARLADAGERPYRARQLWRWLYQRLASSFDEMTDLPVSLRDRLDAEFRISPVEEDLLVRSADGSTRKLLLRLADGQTIETVLMQYEPSERGRARATVCVSTQAGCAMACVFCATGQQGFIRNLTAAEIVGQVLHIARLLRAEGGHVTNVVFMGMGEPLANYDATLAALRTLTDPEGFALGQRHVTVSTVGLVPLIRRFAREGLQVGLAISLHTPDDEQRRRLVPTAKHSVREILAAGQEWSALSGRRFSVEYALVDHENDTPEHARRLADLLADVPCHVNLIPVNPTAQGPGRPSRGRVLAFQRALQEQGINTTVRAEKGIDIAAGCGQLRGAAEGRRPAGAVLPAALLSTRSNLEALRSERGPVAGRSRRESDAVFSEAPDAEPSAARAGDRAADGARRRMHR